MVSNRSQRGVALRTRVVENKEGVVAAYRDGESLNSLCRRWQVSSTWLTQRFREWGVPVRGQAEAFAVLRARRRRGADSAVCGRGRP